VAPERPAAGLPAGHDELLTGWGRTAPSRAQVHRPERVEQLGDLMSAAATRSGAGGAERGLVARGLGRAYGDAAQNAGGHVAAMDGLRALRALDTRRGEVTVDAGVSIGDLGRAVLPFGFFVPVTPGTGHVTVGGAIAADVHGKNHHRDGGFADHVRSLVLLTPAGQRRVVTPAGDADVFRATAGGMGLTGVVVEATIALIRVETARMRVDVERAADLDDVVDRMERTDDAYRYSVAWIDLLARGRRMGRSVLLRGDHARREDLGPKERGAPLAPSAVQSLAVPSWVPTNALRRGGVRIFNEAYFRKAPREDRGRIESIEAFFYPLDVVRGWNRLYGPRGFLQYQFAVPLGAEEALRTIVGRISAAGCPSFLAVLKRFGAAGGLLSFPIPGWTLTLDVPTALDGLGPLLGELDELVVAAGGRVYLAKDSRLRPETLAAMYPELERWREIRDGLDPQGVMCSDLSRRLGLTGPG
jgi:decaprenylphospho-beta-D-ribofuranose 2-oxidase